MGCEQFPSEGYRENALSFYPGQGLHWRSGAIWRNLFGPKSFRRWSQIGHEVDARSFCRHADRTDEFLLLTPTGACVGSPWNATARSTQQTPTIQQKDELDSGRRAKRVYLRQNIFDKFGRTAGCPGCLGIGQHTEECRARVEQEMVDKGDAIKIEAGEEILEEPVANLKKKKIGEPNFSPHGASSSTADTPKRRESEQGSSANESSLADCIAAVNNLLCDVPTVELSRDRTPLSGKFPEDELKAGRELELHNMLNSDAFEFVDELPPRKHA